MADTFSSVTSIPCACGMVERLARDRRYPIVFDDATGEYQLESVDGRWRHQLDHCPWCGGCLPSKRHTLFTEPDAAEQAEVKQLLSHAKSLAEVVQVLGPPDRSADCAAMEISEGDAPNVGAGKRQRSVHQYTARWTTLDVHVIEFDDGSIGCAISGKFKGAAPVPRGNVGGGGRGNGTARVARPAFDCPGRLTPVTERFKM